MPTELVAEKVITVGTPVVIEGASPAGRFRIVFEDDGETGYLYGLDFEQRDNPIVDALHIYNVTNVADRSSPSNVQLIWSSNGSRAALFINDYAHAVFDFEAQRGYCRTGFPPPGPNWSPEGHSWDDKVLNWFGGCF